MEEAGAVEGEGEWWGFGHQKQGTGYRVQGTG